MNGYLILYIPDSPNLRKNREMAHKYICDDRRVMETGDVLEAIEEHAACPGARTDLRPGLEGSGTRFRR